MTRALRILHRLAPLLHDRRPMALDMGGVWDHVLRFYDRKSGFVRRLFSHPPKKPTLWIWRMAADVERPLLRVQTGDDLETRLVDSAFRLLGILQSNPDLVAQLWMFVCLEVLYRLSKVVLDEVEKGAVVLLFHPRVAYDECTVCNDRSGRLIGRGLNYYDRVRCGGRADLVALGESTGTASTENIDVDNRERCGRVGHSFGSIQEASESGKRVADSPPACF